MKKYKLILKATDDVREDSFEKKIFEYDVACNKLNLHDVDFVPTFYDFNENTVTIGWKRKGCEDCEEFEDCNRSPYDEEEEEPEKKSEKKEPFIAKEMPYPQRVKAYNEIIAHHGENDQILKAAEECGELISAIAKFMATDDDTEEYCFQHCVINLLEEIADATIMLEQLRIIFSCNEIVKDIMRKKIERTLERIGEEG